jgi:hypothetical protein
VWVFRPTGGRRKHQKTDEEDKMNSLIMEYQERLGDKHTYDKNGIGIRQLDFRLREAIGKTENIHIARASHNIIKSMEAGEQFCRICGKDLQVVGIARVNDYLVLRHPFCKAPICLDCSKNRPDAFYEAFRIGLDKYKNHPISYLLEEIAK